MVTRELEHLLLVLEARDYDADYYERTRLTWFFENNLTVLEAVNAGRAPKIKAFLKNIDLNVKEAIEEYKALQRPQPSVIDRARASNGQPAHLAYELLMTILGTDKVRTSIIARGAPEGISAAISEVFGGGVGLTAFEVRRLLADYNQVINPNAERIAELRAEIARLEALS